MNPFPGLLSDSKLEILANRVGTEEGRQGAGYLDTTVWLRPRTCRSSFSCWRVVIFSSNIRFFSFCNKLE